MYENKRTKCCVYLCVCVCDLTRVQQLLLHYATAQHLHPVSLESHLHLEGRMGEGEMTVHPAHLHVWDTGGHSS